MHEYDIFISACIFYYDTHFVDEEAKESAMTYPMSYTVQLVNIRARA